VDNREAKFILSAYRPHGQDANDPRFAEAFEQAGRDPILQSWFEESVAFDTVMTEKLCAVTVPADLRENILVGGKIGIGSRPRRRFGKWAIAAALVFIAAVGSLIWQNRRPEPPGGWQTEALWVISSLIRNESSFDAQSGTSAELIRWLRANHAPAAEKLPNKIDKLSSLGCKTFSWKGIPVSVICFTRADGGLIHLVTMNASATTDRAREGKARFVERGEWATATWREGEMIFMLALEGSPEQLRSYLL
jgi:hypothetical protein